MRLKKTKFQPVFEIPSLCSPKTKPITTSERKSAHAYIMCSTGMYTRYTGTKYCFILHRYRTARQTCPQWRTLHRATTAKEPVRKYYDPTAHIALRPFCPNTNPTPFPFPRQPELAKSSLWARLFFPFPPEAFVPSGFCGGSTPLGVQGCPVAVLLVQPTANSDCSVAPLPTGMRT